VRRLGGEAESREAQVSRPKGWRAPHTVALDDQVLALLRDAGLDGMTTGAVWHSVCDTSARPRAVEYLDAYRSLRRLEAAGEVCGLRLGAGQAAMVLWCSSALPVRVPGDSLGLLNGEEQA
jgi:hypothetical protein